MLFNLPAAMSLGHVSDPEAQIDRYCHQVLQLEQCVDFPDAPVLRQDTCQDSLVTRLFSHEAPFPLPPPLSAEDNQRSNRSH